MNRTAQHLKVESALEWAFVQLKPWVLDKIVDALSPEPANITEKLHVFKFKTVEGLLGVNPDCIRIIAVINREIGNGVFSELLALLENAATQHGIDVEFVELWNDRLFEKLQQRGYQGDKNRIRLSTSSLTASSPETS